MAGIIDYYFAPISGYAYLGHLPLMQLAAEIGAEVRFKPLLISKVFAASETTPPFAQSAVRKSYRIEDQKRFATRQGLTMNALPKHWPADPAPACKAILAAEMIGEDQGAVSFACLKAVWAEERNIADLYDLKAALDAAGLPAKEILAASHAAEIDNQLTMITDEAIAAEVFGSPTFVVEGERFWGQDRLDFIRAKLVRNSNSLVFQTRVPKQCRD